MVKLKEIFLEKINEKKDLNKREKKLFVELILEDLKIKWLFYQKIGMLN